jgi:MoxR-like ATPase
MVQIKIKGSYEKVNPVVSVEQILRARSSSWGVHGWKIEKYILDIIFARYPEKYKLADLKPLISFVPRHVLIWRMLRKCYAFIKRRGM